MHLMSSTLPRITRADAFDPRPVDPWPVRNVKTLPLQTQIAYLGRAMARLGL